MKKIGNTLQDLGKALMMPISVIAAAGIFLGLAAALQNPNIMGESFIQLEWLQIIIGFIRRIAGSLFANLPVLFAIAAAIGLAKDEKPTAAFAAVIGFIVMHVSINYCLSIKGITPATVSISALTEHGMDITEARMYAAEFTQVLGIFSYNMSVLGGVIAGLVTVFLHNRYYQTELPLAINFFGGRRFVPIVTVVVLPIVGILLALIWPFIGAAIVTIGEFIGKAGEFGTFVFAFTERLLIPTGLHHILNETVRFTPIGGMVTVDHESVVGALNIFNYALAHPGSIPDAIIREATRFLAQGKIPIMMFGLPGAALAIYRCAKPKHKARVKSLVIAGALASFVTGITEPLEFIFIFVSPVLYLFHAIMSGLSFALMQLFHVMIGNMQGGAIDLVVFGILGGTKTAWWYTVIVGIAYFFIYYFVFKFIINKMNVKTPGREDDECLDDSDATTHISTEQQTRLIIEGLGGKDNIAQIDCCFSRLRVRLKDMSKVDETKLQETNPNGIKRINDVDIQVIYGLKVESILVDVKRALAN